jgi:hypothetical protein
VTHIGRHPVHLPSTYMLIHRSSQTHKTDWLSRLADERRSASRPGVMPRTRPQSAIQQLTVSLGNGCGAVDGLVAMLTDVNGHGHRKPLSLWDRTRPSSRQLKLRAAVGAAPPVPARPECRTWVERRSFLLSTAVLTDAQIWTILRPMARSDTPCSQRPSQLVHPQKFRVPRSSAQRDPCVGRGRVKGIVRDSVGLAARLVAALTARRAS